MSLESKMATLKHLLYTWMTALPRIAYRSTLSLTLDPRGAQKFLHQVLSAQDLEADDPFLGSAWITDLLPGAAEPKIMGPYHLHRSSDTRIFLELVALAYLMQVLRPRVVFEIGTFVGRTTRLLALNCPHDSQIFTLDLPRDQATHDIGVDFRNTPEAAKITQLHGDSRTFDYSSWRSRCDFIWVDACHDYPFVVHDTMAALKLHSEGGWIAWHDYRHTAWWSGVTRAVRELAQGHPGIRHIRGTTIAVLPPKTLALTN
ncbi:MAG: class I SAM-dependent methyltransferase [Desulfobaccales bacterium]